MASQTTTNTSLDLAVSEFPGWYAALGYPDGTCTVGDDLVELVATIIDDYDPGETYDSTVEAFMTRQDFAVQQANLRQGIFALIGSNEGTFDPDNETEEVLTAIFADRDEFIANFPVWGEKTPLVLVATEYEPHSDVPRPTGNVLWIDPSTDRTLLESLAEAGSFEFRVNDAA